MKPDADQHVYPARGMETARGTRGGFQDHASLRKDVVLETPLSCDPGLARGTGETGAGGAVELRALTRNQYLFGQNYCLSFSSWLPDPFGNTTLALWGKAVKKTSQG